MITSIETEKAFDKIQHPFMIKNKTKQQQQQQQKTPQKAGIQGTYLYIIKSIYEKTHNEHFAQWRTLENISLKIRNKKKGAHSHHYYST